MKGMIGLGAAALGLAGCAGGGTNNQSVAQDAPANAANAVAVANAAPQVQLAVSRARNQHPPVATALSRP